MTETDRSLMLDSGEVRVAIDKVWGTAIREIWLGDRNLVNNYDGGRLIGISVYDSAQRGGSHPNDTGWNATPSDWHDHPNPPIEHDFDGRTLYTKVRNLQWFPEGHGGGPDTSVDTDVIVETWVDFLEDPRMVHVRYRLTHEGSDSHLLAPQEFPFAYGRTPFDRYVTYAGDTPWTGTPSRSTKTCRSFRRGVTFRLRNTGAAWSMTEELDWWSGLHRPIRPSDITRSTIRVQRRTRPPIYCQRHSDRSIPG